MKPCSNCRKELQRIKADNLYFCSHKCLVDFVDREKHPLQKSEYYQMCKDIVSQPPEEPTVKQKQMEAALADPAFKRIEEFTKQFGCGKPACCQVVTQEKTCICRTFDGEKFLEEALKK